MFKVLAAQWIVDHKCPFKKSLSTANNRAVKAALFFQKTRNIIALFFFRIVIKKS